MHRCPQCKRRPVRVLPAASGGARWRPFCSERCKLQDLARWADGTYRVARAGQTGCRMPDDGHSESKTPTRVSMADSDDDLRLRWQIR